MRHFCSLLDLSPSELEFLIDTGIRLKQSPEDRQHNTLAGRVVGMMFEKPSMRTRVSFEAAVAHCGGATIFLSSREVGIGERESVQDFARVVSQYIDALVARTFSHDLIIKLARFATCPVINALSDLEHPCQVLADLCTMKELAGPLDGLKVIFVGDGNNVARSLAHGAVLSGYEFILAAPEGYQFDPAFLDDCRRRNPAVRIRQETDPARAADGVDIVYTDVWASMGQEAEQQIRRQVFLPYQVNGALMRRAKPTAKFMHCLPAHRGDEVTDDVIDSPQSVIIEQAGYRLHAQKGLLLWLLGMMEPQKLSRAKAPGRTR